MLTLKITLAYKLKNTEELNHLMLNVHKMVIHTFKTLEQVLQDFKSCINILRGNCSSGISNYILNYIKVW